MSAKKVRAPIRRFAKVRIRSQRFPPSVRLEPVRNSQYIAWHVETVSADGRFSYCPACTLEQNRGVLWPCPKI